MTRRQQRGSGCGNATRARLPSCAAGSTGRRPASASREAARSEVIRVFWALRAFVQRAGAVSGHGADLFFLSIDEILALLGGDAAALAQVPARRAAYARYTALPTYPALISGHFDPERWAADPQRRSDLFDAHGGSAPASATITGYPGAAGVDRGPGARDRHARAGRPAAGQARSW